MDSYATYLQKLSDLIARDEEINLPLFNHESLADIHYMSHHLDRVIHFVIKSNSDIINPLLIPQSSEGALRSQLFLDFQKLLEEKDRLRRQRLKEDEEQRRQEEELRQWENAQKDAFSSAHLEAGTNGGLENKETRQTDSIEQTATYSYSDSSEPTKVLPEYEEVPFTASYGVEKTGVDDYGIDIYGSVAIELFKINIVSIPKVHIQSIILDSNKAKLTGVDEYGLDIYGEKVIEFFEREVETPPETSSPVVVVSNNEGQVVTREVAEPPSEQVPSQEQAATPQQDQNTKVVTIENTPVSSEELEALSRSAREEADHLNDRLETKDIGQENIDAEPAQKAEKFYPKDIQDTDKIIKILSNTEKKIGGWFRGFSKKD